MTGDFSKNAQQLILQGVVRITHANFFAFVVYTPPTSVYLRLGLMVSFSPLLVPD